MVILTIYNRKGGIGKTASTVNIAACLCKEKKKKVLVVDMDSSKNASNYLLAKNNCSCNKPVLVDYIEGKCDLNDTITKVITEKREKFKKTVLEEVDIDVITYTNKDDLPHGNIYNADASNHDDLKDPLVLKYMEATKKALQQLDTKYDICIIDTPPTINSKNKCALYVADYVLTPIEPNTDDIIGFSQVLELMDVINTAMKTNTISLGFFRTGFGSVCSHDEWISHLLKSRYMKMCFSTYIRHAKAVVPGARTQGVPLVYSSYAGEKVTEDYRELTNELYSKIRSYENKKVR